MKKTRTPVVAAGGKARRVRRKLLLLAAATCLALLLGETAIRYRHHAWPFEDEIHRLDHLTDRDAALRWRFSPTKGRNSLGLRNREVGPKPVGVCRILFLGDSLVWSGETSSGKLYTEVLEARLNDRLDGEATSFEVINAGVPGYTTYQELEFLKVYGLDMEPDVVVLGFVFNDVYYKYLHKPTERGILDSEPTSRLHRFDTHSFPGALFARSYLAHELVGGAQTVWRSISRRPAFPFEERRDFYLAWKSYGWTHSRELVGQMQSLLAERDVPLLMIVFPIKDQVDDRYRRLDEQYVLYPQGRLRSICDEYAIPLLDMTEPIHANGAGDLFRDHLHLNGKGNDQVVEEVLPFLEARSLGARR